MWKGYDEVGYSQRSCNFIDDLLIGVGVAVCNVVRFSRGFSAGCCKEHASDEVFNVTECGLLLPIAKKRLDSVSDYLDNGVELFSPWPINVGWTYYHIGFFIRDFAYHFLSE